MKKTISDKGVESWWFWCPGCQNHHRYVTKADSEPIWTKSGTNEKPSFSPSLRCQGIVHCHLYVTNGQIQYLDDCDHTLAGQTIPLEGVKW